MTYFFVLEFSVRGILGKVMVKSYEPQELNDNFFESDKQS